MIDRERLREFVRFVAVGGVATLTHYGIYLLLRLFIDVTVAYSAGYVGSLVLNFYLTSAFTFRERRSVKRGVGFLLSHAVNYSIHIALLRLFIGLGVEERLAPVPVLCIAVPVGFLLVRFVFRSKYFE